MHVCVCVFVVPDVVVGTVLECSPSPSTQGVRARAEDISGPDLICSQPAADKYHAPHCLDSEAQQHASAFCATNPL